MNGHDLRPGRRTRPRRRVELIGGPLDGSTAGEPIEPYAQFILVRADRPGSGPFPIHTYRLDPAGDRYHYCGSRVQSVPR
ncbi:MAG: hypothetical protein ACOC7R_00035 [Planctomycetota bacterium]